MNKQEMIDVIAEICVNSRISDADIDKLLPIMFWIEAELEEEKDIASFRERWATQPVRSCSITG